MFSNNNCCSDCGHSSICKYKEDVLKVSSKIKEIENETENHMVETYVKCKHWTKKTKQ